MCGEGWAFRGAHGAKWLFCLQVRRAGRDLDPVKKVAAVLFQGIFGLFLVGFFGLSGGDP
jgi:hypothetical protein